MKKLSLLFFACILGLTQQAQINKGQTMVGGNVNYYKNSYDTKATHTNSGSYQEYSQFSVNVRAGYFILNKVMVGLSYGKGSTSSNTKGNISANGQYTLKSDGNDASNTFGIFGRYYQMMGKSKFAVFGQLDVGMLVGNGERRDEQLLSGAWWPTYTASTDETGLSSRLGLGLTYFVNRHIAIESYFGAIGYTYYKTITHSDGVPDVENINSNFNSNINFNLSNLFLGINFYFGGNMFENHKPKE